MLPFAVAAGALGVAAPVLALLRSRRRGRRAAESEAFVLPLLPPLPELPPPPVPVLGASPVPEAPEEPGRTSTVGVVLEGAEALLSGNVVKAGLAANEVVGRVVEDLLGQSEGRADAARVVGVAALPVAAAVAAVDFVANAAGIEDQRLVKTLEQTAGAAASGALFLIPPILLAQGASAVLHAISPEADEAVRGVFRALDPTSTTSIPGQVVGGIASGIENLFGGGAEAVAKRKAEEAARAAEEAERRAREEAERIAREREEMARRKAAYEAEQQAQFEARKAEEAAAGVVPPKSPLPRAPAPRKPSRVAEEMF